MLMASQVPAPEGGDRPPVSDRLLTALAFAEAPGLPAGLWQLAVKALYQADIAAQELQSS
jgi:hypothetical protein